MTDQDWKKYGKHLKTAGPCPYCGKPVEAGDWGATYVRSRSGSHIFYHDKCARAKGAKV